MAGSNPRPGDTAMTTHDWTLEGITATAYEWATAYHVCRHFDLMPGFLRLVEPWGASLDSDSPFWALEDQLMRADRMGIDDDAIEQAIKTGLTTAPADLWLMV